LFTIFYSNQAKKFIKDADAKLIERLRRLDSVLCLTPVPASEYDIRKLGGYDAHYRIRLSSYRVTYRIRKAERQIEILQIERRDEGTYR